MPPLLLLAFLALPSAAQNAPLPAPPAVVLSEEDAEKKLADLLKALEEDRARIVRYEGDPSQDFLAAVSFPDREPRWYTMTITRKQWERWNRKARFYEEQKRLYGDRFWQDIDPSEDLRGSQVAALVDVLAVQLHERWPNPVTGFTLDAMMMFEKVTRELPIELRDDAGAFLSERLSPSAPRAERRPDPWALEDEPRRRPTRAERSELSVWEELRPRLSVKLNPNFSDLADPSIKAGAGLSLRLFSDACRFKAEGDYGTKDGDWSCGGYLIFDF